MDTTKTNDIAELTRLGLSTFLHIGLMAQYRYQYALGKELQKYNPVQVDADDVAQNRDKMIKYACFAGVGILGLFAIGFSGLNRK